MIFAWIPQNIYICNFCSIITRLVYRLLLLVVVIYSSLSYATWFDGITAPAIVDHQINTLNTAFKDLTQGVKPLADNITSERVWHDWDDSEPLTEAEYVKIAKFYQFGKKDTLLLSKAFSKSLNKDNDPRNSFDCFSHVFINLDNKSSYVQEFENKITMGDINVKGQPTVFDIVNEAAIYAEKYNNGNKLKYAIRELRKSIEVLQFDYALNYAIVQSNISLIKRDIITGGTEDINKYSLVEHMSFHANDDYNFFENKKILFEVISILKQNAQNNDGILKDLKQINNVNDLLIANKDIADLQNILTNINTKKDLNSYYPMLYNYFKNKKVNEQNCIASQMLPSRDILCTNNSYFLCSILNNFITSRESKKKLYSKKNIAETLSWCKGARLKSKFTEDLGGYNFKYLIKSESYSNILIAAIEHRPNKLYTVGLLYGYMYSDMTQRLETKETSNKLNMNSNFIAVYGRMALDDYGFVFYASYNISNNKNSRYDNQSNNYNFHNECHNISLSTEASMKISGYHKLVVEPALILQSYMHLEHGYKEYSDSIIHQLIPLSIIAKHYQNLDIGAKLTISSKSKGDDDELITKLWISVLQDITKDNPDFLIGVNKSNVLFNKYSYSKRKYAIGLEISWIKNAISTKIDVFSKHYNKKYFNCIGLEINFKL